MGGAIYNQSIMKKKKKNEPSFCVSQVSSNESLERSLNCTSQQLAQEFQNRNEIYEVFAIKKNLFTSIIQTMES